MGRPTFRTWIFNILDPGGPVPLLLDTTKQWSVALEVINNASTLRKKERKRTFCLFCYPDWAWRWKKQREQTEVTQFLKPY